MKRQKLVIFLLLLFSCSRFSEKNYAGSGTLEAREVEISSLLSGKVLSVLVEEGEEVDEGDTLLIIDTEPLRLKRERLEKSLKELEIGIKQAEQAVNQAKAGYKAVSKNYQRIKNLYKKKVATPSQLDEIEAKYKVALAQLRQAELAKESLLARRESVLAGLKELDWQIKQGVVKSPIKGKVIERMIEAGEVVRTGQVVLAIADLSQMELKIYLTEPELGLVKLGEKMEVQVDSFPEKKFLAIVSWISPKAEFTPKNVQTRSARAELVYAVKLVLENPKEELKIGMPADAYFISKQK